MLKISGPGFMWFPHQTQFGATHTYVLDKKNHHFKDTKIFTTKLISLLLDLSCYCPVETVHSTTYESKLLKKASTLHKRPPIAKLHK